MKNSKKRITISVFSMNVPICIKIPSKIFIKDDKDIAELVK